MKYKIVSPRLGTPGDSFDADLARIKGVNVEALIAGGFIVESTPSPKKSAKPKQEEIETEVENEY